MNDVAELKQYVLVHARAQGIPARRYRAVLDRVETDDGDRPGSWTGEWLAEGETLERAGKIVDAFRCYGMARFPYVDGPARERAAERCRELFDRWRTGGTGIGTMDVHVDGALVRCLTSGLSARRPLPVLLVMGGIVTPKEQWGPVLAALRRFGMAGVVTEMPGVGENAVPYDGKSHRMISAVLDGLGNQADTSRTYAMTLSFSGHLALRAAAADPRVRGIVTAGAPISRFFTDREWQARLPAITVDTLAHIMGVRGPDLSERLPELALTADELSGLDIPVHYLASARDEIIPQGEIAELRALRSLRLVTNDDVHGSPSHTTKTRLWSMASVLRMRWNRSPRTAFPTAGAHRAK